MRDVDTIVVHCSASPQGRGDDAETIHAWHQERGFDGIGYHYVILEDGTVQTGRPEYWAGAHVRSHNDNSLGICLIGEGGDATPEQMLSLRNLVLGLYHKYSGPVVCGHNDLDHHKSCPGFSVSLWWQQVQTSDF